MGLSKRTIRRHQADQGGFSLIESIAALIVLSVVLLALTSTMMSGYGALRTTKEEQQAIGVGNEAIEWARSINFDDLAMRTTDTALATDPRITSCTAPSGFTYAFDPDGTGSLACEPIVSSATGGAVDIHTTTQTVDGQSFTVSKYVTWKDVDGGDVKDVKRFTAYVTWTSRGDTRTYRTSTLVSRARKGLPTPSYTVTPAGVTKVVAAGNQAVFQHTIQNLGVLDRYEISAILPWGSTWSYALYKDVNNNNTYDGPTEDELGNPIPAIDTPLTDTDADGDIDTGNLTTNSLFKFFLVVTTSASDPQGTDPVTLSVTSSIDAGVVKEITNKIKVGDANLHLYLQNYPSPATGDTLSQRGLAMEEDEEPTATTLYNYSTDLYTGPGRFVDKGGNKDSTDLTKFVSWNYQMPERTLFNGNATVRIWAMNKPGTDCTKRIKVKVALRTKSSSTTDSKIADLKEEEVQYNPTDCSFHQFDVTLAIANKWVEQNQWLELKAFLPGDSDQVIYAYDTTTYPAVLVMPQVLS